MRTLFSDQRSNDHLVRLQSRAVRVLRKLRRHVSTPSDVTHSGKNLALSEVWRLQLRIEPAARSRWLVVTFTLRRPFPSQLVFAGPPVPPVLAVDAWVSGPSRC